MIDYIPNRPLADAIAQARRDAQAWNALRSTGENKEARWADWAGDQLQAMTRHPDRTILNLESANARLRLAAVALMVDYWPPRESFAARCLRLAFEDPESPIRGAALLGLLRLQMYICDNTGWLKNLLNAVYGSLSEQQAARARRTLEEGRASIQQFERETMKRLAGQQLDRMLQSREAALSFMRSSDAQMRRAALFVLAHNWEMTREFAEECELLLFNDPDTKVRLGALANLGTFYHQSDDRRIGHMLAQIVYDAGEPIELRTHAYRLLFHVRGTPLHVKKSAWSLAFVFPDDVDWPFVDTFLQEGN